LDAHLAENYPVALRAELLAANCPVVWLDAHQTDWLVACPVVSCLAANYPETAFLAASYLVIESLEIASLVANCLATASLVIVSLAASCPVTEFLETASLAIEYLATEYLATEFLVTEFLVTEFLASLTLTDTITVAGILA
jgi:hypothetical protein